MFLFDIVFSHPVALWPKEAQASRRAFLELRVLRAIFPHLRVVQLLPIMAAKELRMSDPVTQWLEEGRIRATKQRRQIAQILVGDGKHRHVTAETVFAAAQQSADPVSLATVYNTLHTFCEAGLLKEITVDGSKSYFDTNVDDHPHYYWEEDGHLSDAPADQLRISSLPTPPNGAEISKVDVIIRLRKA